MALPSTTSVPAATTNTPAEVVPYRLPTSAVAVWTPGPVDTAVLAAIRTRIEPNRGWWQFPLFPMPWQARLALAVYSGVVGLGVIAIAIAAYLGAAR